MFCKSLQLDFSVD
jgi:hypothetical protein